MFYGGFGLIDLRTGGTFVDPTIYTAKARYYHQTKIGNYMDGVYDDIELEVCDLNKFGKEYTTPLIQISFMLSALIAFNTFCICIKTISCTFLTYYFKFKRNYISLFFLLDILIQHLSTPSHLFSQSNIFSSESLRATK